MELRPKHRRCLFRKDEGGFNVSRLHAWSFDPKCRKCLFLEKTKVDLRILVPSVELRPKRRHCIFFRKDEGGFKNPCPKHGASLLSAGVSLRLNC